MSQGGDRRAHETEARLNDYADGLLADREREEVDRHLAGCPECRDQVRRLQDLLARSATLPASLAPPRDLWPDIAERIRRGGVVLRPRGAVELRSPGAVEHRLTSAPGLEHDGERALRPSGIGGRSLWSVRYPLAAAAVVLIVVSSTITALVVGGSRRPPVATRPLPVAATPSAGVLAELGELEAAYREAAAELSATLRESRTSLPTETVAVLERNLRVIDEAIRESGAALAEDPGNPALARMLLATYRQKLDLLQRATRLSAET